MNLAQLIRQMKPSQRQSIRENLTRRLLKEAADEYKDDTGTAVFTKTASGWKTNITVTAQQIVDNLVKPESAETVARDLKKLKNGEDYVIFSGALSDPEIAGQKGRLVFKKVDDSFIDPTYLTDEKMKEVAKAMKLNLVSPSAAADASIANDTTTIGNTQVVIDGDKITLKVPDGSFSDLFGGDVDVNPQKYRSGDEIRIPVKMAKEFKLFQKLSPNFFVNIGAGKISFKNDNGKWTTTFPYKADKVDAILGALRDSSKAIKYEKPAAVVEKAFTVYDSKNQKDFNLVNTPRYAFIFLTDANNKIQDVVQNLGDFKFKNVTTYDTNVFKVLLNNSEAKDYFDNKDKATTKNFKLTDFSNEMSLDSTDQIKIQKGDKVTNITEYTGAALTNLIARLDKALSENSRVIVYHKSDFTDSTLPPTSLYGAELNLNTLNESRSRISGEQRRGLQQMAAARDLGYAGDFDDATLAVDIAHGIIKNDPSAWQQVSERPDLITDITMNLRAEGRSDLIPAVNRHRMNERRMVSGTGSARKDQVKENVFSSRDEDIYFYHHRRNHVRITGSELRKIIKEELRRSMLREKDTVVNIPATEDYKFTAKAVLTQGTMPAGAGKEFTGKLFFDSSVGVAEKFLSDKGLIFSIEPIASSDKTGLTGDQTQVNLKGKGVDAKMVFTDRMTATVSYTY